MSERRRFGIVTSGGDCGGLNAVIQGAAKMAWAHDAEIKIIPNGYAGLYNAVHLDLTLIDPSRADSLDTRAAGSEAGHSRVKISKIKDPAKYDRIKDGLRKHQISALVIAGGDDTGSVVVDLLQNGIQAVHCPKTMDLDLQTYSVGGDSTINRIAQFTKEIRTTALTHNRAMVVEVFGRYSGHTAFRGGVGADADCILIPEIPVDYDIVYEHFKEAYQDRLRKSDVKGATYMIVVAEGITDIHGGLFADNQKIDSFGHKQLTGAAKYVRKQLETRSLADPSWKTFFREQGVFVEGIYETPEIREVTLGHLVRSGYTSAYDIAFGKQAGAAAVLLLLKGIFGVTVVGVRGNEVSYIPTAEAIKRRDVDPNDIALYESMGICFGRKPIEFKPHFLEHKGLIERFF